nr:MFS transporter [uncultured Microbacterium sp.]
MIQDLKYSPGWILLVASVAQLLIAMDSTVMNVAVPSAQFELGFADDQRHWLLSGYALAFGSLLLFSSRVGARLGPRTTLMAGSAGFAASSLVAGLSSNLVLLVLARAMQGASAALIAPAALAALSQAFPRGKGRARAFAAYGAVGVAGAAIGLFAGGALTEMLSWRWTMFVLAIMAGVVLAMGLVSFPGRERSEHRPLRPLSAVLITLGLFSFVLALSMLESGETQTAALLLLGGAGAVLGFIIAERRGSDPLVPARVLRDRARLGALTALGLGSAGLFSVFLFVVYYSDVVLGFDAGTTSIAMIPFPVIAVASSLLLAPRLQSSIGERAGLLVGLGVAGAGMTWAAVTAPAASYAVSILPSIVLVAGGMGVVFATAQDLATRGLSTEDESLGAALVHAFQQIGGAIGITALNAISVLVARTSSDPMSGYIAVFAATAGTYALALAVTFLIWRAGRGAPHALLPDTLDRKTESRAS